MSSQYQRDACFPVFSGQEQNGFGTRAAVPDRTKELIICCGCSYTYGHHVSATESYPFQLSELVPKGFQVLNMGRSGYGLKLCIDWYLRYGASLRPRLCILQIPDFYRQPFPGVHEDLPHHYTLRGGCLRNILFCPPSQSWRMAGICDALIEADVQRLEHFLNSLRLSAVTPFVLFYQPRRGFLRDLVRLTHQRMGAMLSREDVPACTIRFGGRHRHYLLDKTHPNAKGYALFAETVFNVISLK